jgi:hypothetical protein
MPRYLVTDGQLNTQSPVKRAMMIDAAGPSNAAAGITYHKGWKVRSNTRLWVYSLDGSGKKTEFVVTTTETTYDKPNRISTQFRAEPERR